MVDGPAMDLAVVQGRTPLSIHWVQRPNEATHVRWNKKKMNENEKLVINL